MRLPIKKEEQSDAKRGKQDSITLAHKRVRTGYEAHRLEGKVKNVGIKNVGHQKRKSKESD